MSSFHLWLPPLLIWLLSRWGYDRRALPLQSVVGWSVLVVCYFVAPGPSDPLPIDRPNTAFNVNYVFGIGKQPQMWMPPLAWLVVLMGAVPLVAYYPTHVVLCHLCGCNTKAEPQPIVPQVGETAECQYVESNTTANNTGRC